MIELNKVNSYDIDMVFKTGYRGYSYWVKATDSDYMTNEPMKTGKRNLEPLGVFQEYHIVKTWLTDPEGNFSSKFRTILFKTSYLKQLIKRCDKKEPFSTFIGN